MARPEQKRDSRRADFFGILRPLPVFLLVTAASAMIYGFPGLQDFTEVTTPFSSVSTTYILHIFLPVATGLLAALGVRLGRMTGEEEGGSPLTEAILPEGLTEEERSRSIIRHIPLALVSLDRDGKTIFRNPSAQTLFPAGDGDDDPLSRFLEEAGIKPLMLQIFSGGTITLDEVPCRIAGFPDPFTFKITGVPLMKRGGIPEALLIMEDVTQIRKMEDELMRSEERYRNIFNHSASGIFFVDAAGNYLDANPAALKMLGYSLEELLKLNTRELSSDSDSRLRRLKTTPGWIAEEARYLRKDGSIVEAELTASSFRSGNETYFIGITKDITRRRILEHQLEASRNRFNALLRSMEEPIIIFDRDGQLAEISEPAAKLLDMDTGRLEPTAFEVLAPGQGGLTDLPEGKPVPLSLRIPGGRTLEVMATFRPLGPRGEIGSVLHIERV